MNAWHFDSKEHIKAMESMNAEELKEFLIDTKKIVWDKAGK